MKKLQFQKSLAKLPSQKEATFPELGNRKCQIGKPSPMNEMQVINVHWDYVRKSDGKKMRTASTPRKMSKRTLIWARNLYDWKESLGLNPVIVIEYVGFMI